MIPQEITEYLIRKYQPNAIILHGSRARGDAFENSDYDLELIGSFSQEPSPEEFNSYILDVGGYSPTLSCVCSGDTPIWPLTVLYDDENGFGKAIQDRTENAYRKGPEPLEAQQISQRKNVSRRIFNRLQNHHKNIQLRTHYIADFHERAVRYHFELSRKWTSSLHRSLKQIQEEKPELYRALDALCQTHSLDSFRTVFKLLFNEPL